MRLTLLLRRFSIPHKQVILFILIAGGLTSLGYFAYEDLRIDHVSLVGAEEFEQDIIGPDVLYGKNIVFVDESEMESLILTQNPYLRSVELEKSYPNKVSFEVTAYEPLAYLAVDTGYLLIAQDGRILEKVRNNEEMNLQPYPVITYYQQFPFLMYQAGEYLDIDDIQATLHVLHNAQILGLEIQEIVIENYYMISLKGKEITIYFSAEKDEHIVSDEMKKIVRQLKLDGTKFRVLNLRFERPVVEYY